MRLFIVAAACLTGSAAGANVGAVERSVKEMSGPQKTAQLHASFARREVQRLHKMTLTAAQFRASARHLLRCSRPALADQWSVLIYAIDGGAETCEVMNTFPSTLVAIRAFEDNWAELQDEERAVTVTAGQLKVARQLLGWNQEQLAVEARVSPSIVSQFEAGRHRSSPGIVSALQSALEAAGIEFTNDGEPGVKLRKAK
jgi:DNA-binding XRE family transcriptional regulator